TWPTVSGAATDAGSSGVAGLQYKIGSAGTWYGDNHTGAAGDVLANDGSYTTDVTYDYPNLNEGVNQIFVRVLDNAGNTSAQLNATIKINTSAPSAPQDVGVTPTSS